MTLANKIVINAQQRLCCPHLLVTRVYEDTTIKVRMETMFHRLGGEEWDVMLDFSIP